MIKSKNYIISTPLTKLGSIVLAVCEVCVLYSV